MLQDLPHIVRMLHDDPLGAQREHLTDPLPDCYYRSFAAMEHDPNNQLFVAELDGAVIGTFQLTIIAGLSHQGGTNAQIEAVRIAAEHRSKGYGEAMIREAIVLARARGCYRLQLTTHKSRKDAQRFYTRLGFTASHEGMKLSL